MFGDTTDPTRTDSNGNEGRTRGSGSRRQFMTAAAVVGTGLLTGTVPAVADEYDGTDDHDESEDHGNDENGEIEDGARIVHLSPDAPVVDVYVDGELWFEGVEPFGTQTEYLEYVPGTYTVQFTPAGEGPEAAVLESEVTFEEGRYTVAAVGEVCAISDEPLRIVTFEDDTAPTEAGHARVRGIHASPDAPPVDVTVDGEPVVGNLGFGEGENADVPVDGEVLEVRERATGSIIERFEIDLEAGHAYTVFVVGYVDPESAPEAAVENAALRIGITEDAVPGER